MSGVNIPIRATDMTRRPTRAAANNFHTMSNRITASVARTVKALGAFSSVALAGMGAGLVFMGKTVFQTTARLESMRIGIMATAKDTRLAASDFNFMQEQADRLGLSFDAMVGAFVKYNSAAQASGLSADDTRESFIAVSEAAAIFGLSADSTRLALRALEQMMSKGKVSAEEFRQQLGEHIPGTARIAADALGVTEKAFNKMLESGQIMARDFVPKFGRQMRLVFGSQVPAATERAQAGVERFKNQWTLLLERVGKGGFAKVVSDAMNDLANTVRSVRVQFASVERAVIHVTTVVKTMGAITAFVVDMTRHAFGFLVLVLADHLPRAFETFKADFQTGMEHVAHAFAKFGNWLVRKWGESVASLKGPFAVFVNWVGEGFAKLGMSTAAESLKSFASDMVGELARVEREAEKVRLTELLRHHQALSNIKGTLIKTLDELNSNGAWEAFVGQAGRSLGTLASEIDRIMGEASDSLSLSHLFEDQEKFDLQVSKFVDILTKAENPADKFVQLLTAIEAKAVNGMTAELADQMMALNDAMDAMLNRPAKQDGQDERLTDEQMAQFALTEAVLQGVQARMRITKMWVEYDRKAALERAKTEQEVQNTITANNQTVASSWVQIQSYLVGKSKDWARAMVLINKGAAMAQAYANSQLAYTKALSITANPGLAETVRQSGFAAMAAIAGSGLAQLASINESGGGSVSAPGAVLNPINTTPVQQTAPEVQPQTTIYFSAPVLTDDPRMRDWLVGILRDAGRNGSIIFEQGSDQAAVFQGA